MKEGENPIDPWTDPIPSPETSMPNLTKLALDKFNPTMAIQTRIS